NELNLLLCSRCKPKDEDPYSMQSRYYSYEKIMSDWDKDFLLHLKSPTIHYYHDKGFYFLGLQRWNSSSPAKGYSVGGGYLLYHIDKDSEVDMGIAIDPGFDFVRNLFHSGFSLNDIDIVLISHAHLDHIRDFESIVTLLFELQKRSKRDRRVHVILSLGSYKRLEHIIEDPTLRYFIEPYIIDINREIQDKYFEMLGDGDKAVSFLFETANYSQQEQNLQIERIRAILPEERNSPNYLVKIRPTRAYHEDNSQSDSFGFLIELRENSEQGG
ncbi:unnamed protein product, partial [marine sediment metagenome]